MSKHFSLTETIAFWGFELLGGAVGAVIGTVLGYGVAGLAIGVIAGGVAFIALRSRFPSDPA